MLPDAVYRDVNYDNAIVTTNVTLNPTVTTSVSCQWFDYADSPSDITLSNSPYYNSASALNDRQIKISAYSFRAYEGIYNAPYIVIIVIILIMLTDKFSITSGYRPMTVV